jgi:uroporphyrin-3 C-methyltransferase
MNDTDKDKPQADATFDDVEADDGLAEESKSKPKLEAPKEKAPRKSGASASIAWLALFLSLIAAAGLGYLTLDKIRSSSAAGENERALAELQREIGDTAQSVEGVRDNLSGLSNNDTQTSAAINSLRRDMREREDLFNTLPPRMSTLERSVAALQGVSIEARNTYLIAEAEYYMQIANAQLQLAGNPHLAALALGMADERIVQLSDPALTGVRRALSDELAALDVMEKPDIEGITLTLSSLARVVASLPLRQAASTGIDEDTAVDPDLSGANRAWASVKGAVSGLVRVTPPNEIAAPLMTPDAVYFLRTNLTLQLQAARLALLRGEQAVFEQSLDDAAQWLDLYFDAESAQVRGAKATLAEIRSGLFAVAPPDISESLRLLRQFNSISESAQ